MSIRTDVYPGEQVISSIGSSKHVYLWDICDTEYVISDT